LPGAAVCASPALAADAAVTGASLVDPATRARRTEVSFGHLETLPKREQIRQRLTQLWDYQRTSLPQLEAHAIWFQQNSGLQRQAPLYRATAPSPN
jgi:hypothetical protein